MIAAIRKQDCYGQTARRNNVHLPYGTTYTLLTYCKNHTQLSYCIQHPRSSHTAYSIHVAYLQLQTTNTLLTYCKQKAKIKPLTRATTRPLNPIKLATISRFGIHTLIQKRGRSFFMETAYPSLFLQLRNCRKSTAICISHVAQLV